MRAAFVEILRVASRRRCAAGALLKCGQACGWAVVVASWAASWLFAGIAGGGTRRHIGQGVVRPERSVRCDRCPALGARRSKPNGDGSLGRLPGGRREVAGFRDGKLRQSARPPILARGKKTGGRMPWHTQVLALRSSCRSQHPSTVNRSRRPTSAPDWKGADREKPRSTCWTATPPATGPHTDRGSWLGGSAARSAGCRGSPGVAGQPREEICCTAQWLPSGSSKNMKPTLSRASAAYREAGRAGWSSPPSNCGTAPASRPPSGRVSVEPAGRCQIRRRTRTTQAWSPSWTMSASAYPLSMSQT